MQRMTTARVFEPRLPHVALRRMDALLAERGDPSLPAKLRGAAESAEARGGVVAMEETAILRVLADLAAIGWQFRVVRGKIYMIPRRVQQGDPVAAKHLLRASLRDTRDQQLAESSTVEFFRRMHAPRAGSSANKTIDVLVDDGATLARDLREHRVGDLTQVIQPYLQFVLPGERCAHTGLLLTDIWRYFRHTWSLEFRPTPGRNINYLIRNAARPGHPVMAIVGLANAVFQLSTRDNWIGWTEPAIVRRIIANPSEWPAFRDMAIKCLADARKSIRSDDLARETGNPKSLLEFSRRLDHIAQQQGDVRKQGLRDIQSSEEGDTPSPRALPKRPDGTIDWKKASESPLFKRKRAGTLSSICFALHHLRNSPTDGNAVAAQVTLTQKHDNAEPRWQNDDLGRAVRAAIREIKKNGVASRILDVNVCGASPSYREILGGKLAAMSLFASDIQDTYLDRYASTPAEIASAMAGRPICKKAHVCILTTTSLYEVGSSQYNRVRVRFGPRTLEWQRIGETEGFGSLHFSKPTIECVRRLTVERTGLRNVNNVFGEGTSPLLRQMREGLTILGFETNDVLQHTNKRIVYAAEIYPGAREDLVANGDTYSRGPVFSEIARDWAERWLRMRIKNEEALNRMADFSPASVKRDLHITTNGADTAP